MWAMPILNDVAVRSRPLVLAVASILWLCAVGAGLWILWSYENAPGNAGRSPASWPVGTAIPRSAGHAALVMFAHPRCPCTRATIGELALLMTRCQGLVTAHVLFFKPADFADEWAKTDIWESAAAIPGVDVMCDAGGNDARRFHATTSGQTLLYDTKGRLIFRGGITGARGHSGDNAGRSLIVALLTRGSADRAETSVFG